MIPSADNTQLPAAHEQKTVWSWDYYLGLRSLKQRSSSGFKPLYSCVESMVWKIQADATIQAHGHCPTGTQGEIVTTCPCPPEAHMLGLTGHLFSLGI